MNVLELSEQEIIRRNSLNELRAMGIEPYPAAEYVNGQPLPSALRWFRKNKPVMPQPKDPLMPIFRK